jgi:predicted nuclease of predicted toxin-antitoxin system
MSLVFFCDHCIPGEIAIALRSAGHSAILLRDVMPPRSPDAAVIAKAQELDAILMTLDGDFSDIVAYPPASFGGIMALQLHNRPEIIPVLMKRLNAFIQRTSGAQLLHGQTVHRRAAPDSNPAMNRLTRRHWPDQARRVNR